MSLELTVCGPRGSFPVYGDRFREFGHDTSCYCLRDGESGLIMDCGSGLQRAEEILSDCSSVDVVLSHLHYDHIMGLFESRGFFEKRNVTFYGNFDAWRKAERERGAGKTLFSVDELIPGRIRSIEYGLLYELHSGFQARFTPSSHGDDTSMIEIVKGKSRICFTGDYEHREGYPIGPWVRGCDLLLFDGSYTPEDYPKYRGYGHSSWKDGCLIAMENSVRKLLITHHAPQYDDEELFVQEKLAEEIFTDTEFARQGRVCSL